MIGHSLGGLIVERAVSQAFLAKWLDSAKVLEDVVDEDEDVHALREANEQFAKDVEAYMKDIVEWEKLRNEAKEQAAADAIRSAL